MARDRDRDRDRDKRKGGPAAAGRRPMKKKVCMFCSERSVWADYKDANLLKRFLSERAKIRARRVTGNCARHQREVAVAIKTARELALLPYQQRQVTDRSRGAGRGRRDRDEGTLQTLSPFPRQEEFEGRVSGDMSPSQTDDAPVVSEYGDGEVLVGTSDAALDDAALDDAGTDAGVVVGASGEDAGGLE